MSDPNSNAPQLSLSASAARNLATATLTVPQMQAITPRWLHKLLPWVDVDGGVYRVNHVLKKEDGTEQEIAHLTVDTGEPQLPTPVSSDNFRRRIRGVFLIWFSISV